MLGMTENVTLPKSPFRMKPVDFTDISGAVLVYSGPLCGCRMDQIPEPSVCTAAAC